MRSFEGKPNKPTKLINVQDIIHLLPSKSKQIFESLNVEIDIFVHNTKILKRFQLKYLDSSGNPQVMLNHVLSNGYVQDKIRNRLNPQFRKTINEKQKSVAFLPYANAVTDRIDTK